jgi:hypothetical protein
MNGENVNDLSVRTLADGLHAGLLTVLVFDGLAEMQRIVTDIGGRQRTVTWMKITPAGREAIAEYLGWGPRPCPPGPGLGPHRSITSTAVYTALAPNRFKDFWRE